MTEGLDIKSVKDQISDESTEGEILVAEDTLPEEPKACAEQRSEEKSRDTIELFKMVFEAAQRPDEDNKKLQRRLAHVLMIAVCVQVLWAMLFITYVVVKRSDLASNMLTFVSLLVTAVLAEVVAMGFFMVKFVFRTPIDMMLDLLKDIIEKR